MNKKIFLFAVMLALFSTSCNECSKRKMPEKNIEPQVYNEKGCTVHPLEQQPKWTVMLILNYVWKTKNAEGKTVFVDREGNASYRPSLAEHPFSISGSGVMLKQGYIGTVAHLHPGSAQEQILAYSSADSDNALFLRNFKRSVEEKMLMNPLESSWEFYRVNSFLVPAETSANPIQRSLESAPFKTPPECFEIDLIYNNEGNDVAIYKCNKKLPKNLSGYSTCDFITESELKKISNGSAVVNWGYPVDIRSIVTQHIEAKPDLIHTITGLPSPTFPFVQTNLQARGGSSGSFILDKETGKILAIISVGDSGNETLCIPAHYLNDLYLLALK